MILTLLVPFSVIIANEYTIEESIKALLEQFLHHPEDHDDSSFSTTSHSIELPSGPFHYKAITGTLPQYLENGEIAGQIFFTAYLKDIEENNRPVSFIFNGGPGGSSMAMHIAGFGPRRLVLPEEGQTTLPPYKMIDNPETMLDVSDLVLIDPVGTGYSKEEREEYLRGYFSVEGDLYSFAEFIRMF